MKNKIFTDSIFDVKGKNYPKEQKINWERIGEKAITAFCVGAVGYFIIRTIISFL